MKNQKSPGAHVLTHYVAELDSWVRKNQTTLKKLYANFLFDMNTSPEEPGNSFPEFCLGMFKQCEPHAAALAKCIAAYKETCIYG